MILRGVEAAGMMVSTLTGAIHPVVALKKLPMMPPTINMRTTEGPMVQLFKEAREMEAREGVINVSVFGGFPYADVERVGSSVVVVTDGDIALAKQLSTDLGGVLWSLRNKFLKELVSVEHAVDKAVRAAEGPIILADVADNPGGGAPGDGTVILRALLEKNVENVGFAVIKDLEAVERAIETGVRGRLRMTIGGKTDNLHGEPVEVCGQVRTITDGRFIHKAMNPVRYTSRPHAFAQRRDDLNQVLAFAGMHLGDDGKLRPTDRASNISEAKEKASRLHSALENRNVHADVLKFCRAELVQENYFHAVFEAMKSVAAKIRQMSGLTSDGAELVRDAFSLGKECNPLLAINPLATETDQGEQRGFVNLLIGLFGVIRNPLAHNAKIEWEMNEQDALDVLTTASLIHRKLDKAHRFRK